MLTSAACNEEFRLKTSEINEGFDLLPFKYYVAVALFQFQAMKCAKFNSVFIKYKADLFGIFEFDA